MTVSRIQNTEVTKSLVMKREKGGTPGIFAHLNIEAF